MINPAQAGWQKLARGVNPGWAMGKKLLSPGRGGTVGGRHRLFRNMNGFVRNKNRVTPKGQGGIIFYQWHSRLEPKF
ncbi:MAG: hypothetical protein D6732_20105 [Methanobacteriota archaeon]|nr:MAG: hypothetical protein D6732_20105 [Euryarchaeota archaeon]